MSAWIVTKAHIDALVHALGKREMLEATLDETGQMLWHENHLSVNYRYNEQTPTPTYVYAAPPVAWTPSQLDKIVRCWNYQTCEHPEYEDSIAYRLVAVELTEALAREGVNEESHRDTPWGLPSCGGNHGYIDCADCIALDEQVSA